MKKSQIITIITILAVILFAIWVINSRNANPEDEVAKCIGENSILYIQLGCHACEIQENLFGENLLYLNTIDCFYERKKCENITGTPTWEINGEYYIGVQSVEKLKELTGC